LKLTADRHEASRGFSATAELLVGCCRWKIIIRTALCYIVYYSCDQLCARFCERDLDIPPRTYSPGHFPARKIRPPFLHGVGHSPLPPPPCANLYKAICCNLELALTRIPDPNRCGVLTLTLTLTDPRAGELSEN